MGEGFPNAHMSNRTKERIMTTAPKIFLTISITAFALSLTAAGSDFGWGILKPLSAVMFGAFFISNLFAKDVAEYDQAERARRGQAQRAANSLSKTVPSLNGVRSSPALETQTVH